MRTIALVLNDNDYGNTFRPLLESIARAIAHNGEMSPDGVRAAVAAGIEFHYVAFQCAGRNDEPGQVPMDAVLHHLRDVRVLFDEEAEADICAPGGHDGGAWYLELGSGNITAY